MARYLDRDRPQDIQKRLGILLEQDLIGRRYKPSYHLSHKPAAYYLRPRGARALSAYYTQRGLNPVKSETVYRLPQVSEGFTSHCMSVLGVYLRLRQRYRAKLTFMPRQDLRDKQLDYLPQPLSDAYLRLKSSDGTADFFLELFDQTTPSFIRTRRIKQYLEYAEDQEWERANDTELPAILFICEQGSAHKRLRRSIATQLRNCFEEPRIASTTIDQFLDQDQADDKIWLPISEDGDDTEFTKVPQPQALSAFVARKSR